MAETERVLRRISQRHHPLMTLLDFWQTSVLVASGLAVVVSAEEKCRDCEVFEPNIDVPQIMTRDTVKNHMHEGYNLQEEQHFKPTHTRTNGDTHVDKKVLSRNCTRRDWRQRNVNSKEVGPERVACSKFTSNVGGNQRKLVSPWNK